MTSGKSAAYTRAMLHTWNHSSLDADETRLRMGSVLRRHRLRVHGPTRSFLAEMEHIGNENMSMTRLSYGTAVDVEAEPEPGFWIFSLPLRGRVVVRSDGLRFDSRPGFASVISSESNGYGRWETGARQAIFRLREDLLKEAAESAGLCFDTVSSRRLLGLPIGPQLGVLPGLLDTLIKLDVDYCRRLPGELLERQWHNAAIIIAHAVVGSTVETVSNANWGAQVRPGRRLLEAETWLRDTIAAHDFPSVHALASHLSLSLRALQLLIRQQRGMTTHQFIEGFRLRQARRLLRHPSVSVRDAAVACGFNHLGRFAASYFRLFAVTPSRDRDACFGGSDPRPPPKEPPILRA